MELTYLAVCHTYPNAWAKLRGKLIAENQETVQVLVLYIIVPEYTNLLLVKTNIFLKWKFWVFYNVFFKQDLTNRAPIAKNHFQKAKQA